MNPSPYATLGVPPDASKADIRRAYLRRAKEAHPDAGGTDADFDALNRAKTLLLDDARRARFDATGDAEDRADDDASVALSTAIGLVQSTITAMRNRGRDPERENVIEQARMDADAKVLQLEIAARNARAEAAKALRVAERVSARGDAPNLIGRALQAEAAKQAAAAEKTAEVVTILKAAIKLIDQHEFAWDRAAGQSAYSVRQVFIGSGWST